ncbi:bactofilin [Paenibacillus sp. YIM B09110]|uniref:bactofilin n=1 Tax=Paenibacillus sp. YIM B09110 TaxID=3126102 RepID=UPI00301E1649
MSSMSQGGLTSGGLTITGSSVALGGHYDRVKIVGEGSIEGDVQSNKLKVMGTLEMNGRLQTKDIHVVGTAVFSDHVQAATAKVTGTATVAGNAQIQELRCSGAMEVAGNVRSERFILKGELKAKGACEADQFTVRGMFHIGGLLNAGRLDIKLYQDCSADEIGGEKITIKKASLLNPFNLFFFRPDAKASLTTNVIEGDQIYIEYTKANIVRGKRVTIGPGCEIGAVEYKESFELMSGSTVKQKRKI